MIIKSKRVKVRKKKKTNEEAWEITNKRKEKIKKNNE